VWRLIAVIGSRLARAPGGFSLQRRVSGVAGPTPTVDGPARTPTKGTVMLTRWLAALLFTGGLAVGLGVDMTVTAHASDPTRPGRTWHEISLPFGNGKGSAMCVGVPGGSTVAGTPLRLSRCDGYASDGAPQRWHFPGGRFQKVTNTNSGLCIGFPGAGVPVTGARLVQDRCDQVPAWQLVPQGRDGTDPLSVLETSGPGGPALCMTAAGLSDADAAPLVALPCAGFQDAGQLLELG
jgi:hypothetical protein